MQRLQRIALGVFLGAIAIPLPGMVQAQGCMPSRFATPGIGAKGDIYLPGRTWQFGLGYRRATSNQKIVGHDVLDVLPNGKLPSEVRVQTMDLNVAYAVSDRLSLTLDIPVLHGSHVTNYPDGQRHQNTATGLGDITVLANYWLRNVGSLVPGGNVSLGFGVKAPTGRNDVGGSSWRADGTAISFPVHPSIELGDGGWGAILQVQGFQPVWSQFYLYAAGSYTLSTRTESDVPDDPGSSVHWAVPDTWDARAGGAVALLPETGLSVSLGVRFDGTPRRDIIGGRDMADRLPATAGFLEPGISLVRGAHTFSLSAPLRIYQNFRPSYLDQSLGDAGGGGLSRFMVFFSYSVRM